MSHDWGSDDIGRVALAIEQFPPEDFNHVAACGHEVRLVEARAHRQSQGPGSIHICPTCDMMEILGTLWTLELSAEHCVAVVEDMIGTETDVVRDLVTASATQDEDAWKKALYTIIISRFLNSRLYEFKRTIRRGGLSAIYDWETCWGQDWDLSLCEVQYKTSGAQFLSEGASEVTVDVKVERNPGTTCKRRAWGLPDIGMPLSGTFFATTEGTMLRGPGYPVFTPVPRNEV